jgi:hypothetical protein
MKSSKPKEPSMHPARSRISLLLFTGAFACGAPAAGAEEPPRPSPKDRPVGAGPNDRAYLGIETETKSGGEPGVFVAYIHPMSPAKEMGFQIGDELRAVNDVLISTPEAFVKEIRAQNIGARLRFLLRRGGQDTRIEGRLGSYTKTMLAYQESLRKEMVGKPLPPPPAPLWWDVSQKTWKERQGVIDGFKGRHTLIFSFDDCPQCKRDRYQKILQLKNLLEAVTPGLPLAFAGVFFRPAKTKEENLAAAAALFTDQPPPFPVAIANHASARPTPEEREKHVFFQNHGTAILDPNGNVRYLQIHDVPGEEFSKAYQAVIQEIGAARGGAPAAKSEGKAPGTP